MHVFAKFRVDSRCVFFQLGTTKVEGSEKEWYFSTELL